MEHFRKEKMEWMLDYLRRFSFHSAFSSIITYILTFSLSTFSFSIADAFLSLYFRFCGLSPISIHIDDDTTTLHFWVSDRNRRRNPSDEKMPNLVMIHGKCGDSRWQFMYQVGNLSRRFELFIPDLLFFGKSYTTSKQRSEIFQAKCLAEGLSRLGVDRFSVYGISYGGYVGYHLAQMGGEKVDKVVLMSTGVGCSYSDKQEMVRKLGMDPKEILVPSTSAHLRELLTMSVYRGGYIMNLVPDSFLQGYLNALSKNNRKEKMELVDHLLGKNSNNSSDAEMLPALAQETLLIWGDKDSVFPVKLAYQLQKHIGSKARVAIVKDTGHAVNMEAPSEVNRLISSFILTNY
ncbi:Monoacylglycerol lipase ABHD6 [Linum perenne]